MIYINARFLTQPLTGVQRYAFEVCMQMKKMDPEIVFLSPPKILQPQNAEALGVKLIGKRSGHFWEQIELPAFLKKQPDAVLFSPCNTGPLFFNKHFLCLHDLAFALYPQFNTMAFRLWYNFLIPRLCKKAKRLFTVSDTVRHEIMQQYGISSANISITYNGIAETMKVEQGISIAKQKVIISVGSNNPRKNMKLLVDAFLDSSLCTEYRLVLIGQSFPIYPTSNMPKHSSVKYIAECSDAELKAWYNKAEIACFPSLYEGFGIPVLEAIQFGCKVICNKILVFEELYNDAVYFCDATNKSELSTLLNLMPFQKVMPMEITTPLLQKFNYQNAASVIYKILQKA